MNSEKNDAVQLDGKDIEDVDEFTYLGAIVSKDGGGGNDMNSRIYKARIVFKKLNKVWRSKQYGR